MRLFIAINFPDEIKETLAAIRNTLKESALRGNFSFDNNLHLTLVFLGECDVRQVETIKAVMNGTLFPPFALRLNQVDYFKRDGGNTWWIGLKENNSISALQADLTKRLKDKGFVLENRPYMPHITVAREVVMPAGFVKPEIRQLGFEATHIELMKSERTNGKLAYTTVYKKVLSDSSGG